MNHVAVLKQAFFITWRYRALWIFGFLLALCGGGGGGGGFNFLNINGGKGIEIDLNNLVDKLGFPQIDPNMVIAVFVGVISLIVLLMIVGIIVQYVTRTAIICMVRQIKETETVTAAEGWRLGWSSRTWRVFLLSLSIGVPLLILTLILIGLACSPLLLLLLEDTSITVVSIVLTVLAVIFVILLLIVVYVIIDPIRELAWRRTALDQCGVIDSLRETVWLVKRRFKDVAIIWLLMLGVSIGWGFVGLFIILAALIAAGLIGGILAGLVYLISQSGWGAAIAGIPLGLLVFILIACATEGFFLIYRSTVWTLFYLEIEESEQRDEKREATRPVET